MRLLIQEILEQGKNEIVSLDPGSHVIGRDLTADIPMSAGALSRQHGIFLSFTSGWGYLDFASTNGSFLNGNKLTPHIMYPLKDLDYLQVADTILQLTYLDITSGLSSSLRLVAVSGQRSAIEINPEEYDTEIPTDFGISFRKNTSDSLILLLDDDLESKEVNDLIEVNGKPAEHGQLLYANDYVSSGDTIFLLLSGTLYKQKPRAAVVVIPENVQTSVDLTSPGKSIPQSSQVFAAGATVFVDSERQRKVRFGDDIENDRERDSSPVRPQSHPGIFDFNSQSDSDRRLLVFAILFLLLAVLLLIIWFVL